MNRRMTSQRSRVPQPFLACVLLLTTCATIRAGDPDSDALPRKKLIETGWDMPTPRQVRDNLAEMEKRPFDGVVISLSPALGSAFENKAWNRDDFRQPIEDLKACKFKRFTDNFLMLNANPGNVDWFDDAGWKSIVDHWRIAAWAARESGVKGILFDPEAYVNPHAQFRYSAQPEQKKHTFAEYSAKARQRGREVMQTIAEENPRITIFSYFLGSIAAPSAGPSDLLRSLANEGYGLLPAFLDGWLDAAPPTVTFVDGDERGYRYNDRKDYLEAALQIKGLFQQLVSPANRAKYRAQVQVSSGLYLDAYVNPPSSPWYIDGRGEPRIRRLAENVASALHAADEYVWIYGEKGRWWPAEKSEYKTWPEVFPECDSVLATARDPIAAATARVEELRGKGSLTDLVKNGDFQKGPSDAAAGGPPAGWETWQSDRSHGRFEWDAKTGDGSAVLRGITDGCFIQSYPAQPSEKYFVVGKARRRGAAEPHIRVRWQTAGGKWTAEARDVLLYCSASSTDDWAGIAGVVTVPDGAGKLVVLLGVSGQGEPAEAAWFDDVRIHRLP